VISQPFLDYVDVLDIESGMQTNIDALWDCFKYEFWNSGDIRGVMIAMAQHCFYALSVEYYFQFPVKEHIKKLHKDKNAGYSGTNADPWYNIRQCEQFGIHVLDGVVTRMCDKYSRLTNLRNDPKLDRVKEPIADVYRDLGAYALIYLCLLDEGKRNTPLTGYTYTESI
jgi:hypothetical protein